MHMNKSEKKDIPAALIPKAISDAEICIGQGSPGFLGQNSKFTISNVFFFQSWNAKMMIDQVQIEHNEFSLEEKTLILIGLML